MKELKKWLHILLLSFLILGLTACGDNDEPEEDATAEEENDTEENTDTDENEVEKVDEQDESEEKEEENDGEITASSVYEEAVKASEELKSTKLTMDVEQEIHAPDMDEPMTMNIQGETEMTLEPLTLYQNMTTNADIEGEKVDSKMEVYATEDDLYLYEEQLDEWIKMDSSMMGEIGDIANQEDPADQLKMFEQFVSEFDLEETDDEFILKIEIDGNEFTSLMEEMAGGLTPNDIMQGIDGEGGDIFKEMEISQMDYEMYIDKETYHLNQFNMNMDMDMEMDGESASIVQSIKSDYSNINEINPIEVPEDVKDAAIDQSELDL